MDEKVNSKPKFKINPVVKFFLILIPAIAATFFISYYGCCHYLESKKALDEAMNNGIRLYNVPNNINKNISKVSRDTITLITSTHTKLNDAVCYDNKPTEDFYNLCSSLSSDFSKAAEKESWDYLKYDLERTSVNLKAAYTDRNEQALVISHRIVHDLDVNIFNINSNINSNRSHYCVSATYRLCHGMECDISQDMPPAGT